MKQLLEDYKRKLISLNKMIKDDKENPFNELEKTLRLRTKASCYRTFITELERAIENEKNEQS